MNTPYFRAGAGCVIYREDGSIIVFKRTREDIWQFQQGGTDAGETPEETLWRELEEETAFKQSDFITSHPYPYQTTYYYPENFTLPPRYKNCLGQKHHWWFLEINPKTVIDLSQATDKEFEDYKWISFTDYMNLTVHSFKHDVYQKLHEYFNTHILPSSIQ